MDIRRKNDNVRNDKIELVARRECDLGSCQQVEHCPHIELQRDSKSHGSLFRWLIIRLALDSREHFSIDICFLVHRNIAHPAGIYQLEKTLLKCLSGIAENFVKALALHVNK